MKTRLLLTAALAGTAAFACSVPQDFKPAPADAAFAAGDLPQNLAPAGWSLLNIWALWCAPCRKELPLLNEHAAGSGNPPVITVNLDDGAQAVAQFFQKQKLEHLPAHSTADSALLSNLHSAGLPYTALLYNGQPQFMKNGVLHDTDLKQISEFIACKQKENSHEY